MNIREVIQIEMIHHTCNINLRLYKKNSWYKLDWWKSIIRPFFLCHKPCTGSQLLVFPRCQPIELHHPLLVRLIYTNNFTSVTHHLLIMLKHVEKACFKCHSRGYKTSQALTNCDK